MNENDQPGESSSLKEKLTGAGQVILGEIETIGGVLTGDPNTQAEGQFNVEVGTVREEIEDQSEEVFRKDTETQTKEIKE